MIRGFEPVNVVSDSHSGAADILSQRVPAYVEKMLEGRKASHGYSLEDAATMVAIVEQLIFDSENAVLETSYSHLMHSHSESLNRDSVAKLIEAYLVHWMMGDDEQGVRLLMSNKTILQNSFPQWKALAAFADGQIKALEFDRQQRPRRGRGFDTLSQRFTFDDAHEIVGGITKSFASFWESECVAMKDSLVAMDTDFNGRVPLSMFYGKGMGDEWRFAESEAYLRELGALDESSVWKGKQVIIPNYLQAASNCIVSTPHYLVCCEAECEGFLSEIEAAVGAPMAASRDIMLVVGNMSSVTSSLNHDESPQLEGALVAQLERLAVAHGGKVPLHSRLFSQWLHYVFPRECPFPHKAGTAAATRPTEFGGAYLATKDEMNQHAQNAISDAAASERGTTEELPSQWSEEQELFADYGMDDLSAPWGGPGGGSCMLLGLFVLAAALFAYWNIAVGLKEVSIFRHVSDSSEKMLKSHMV